MATSIASKFEGQTRFDLKTGKAYILGEEVTHEGYDEYMNLPDRDNQRCDDEDYRKICSD